MIRRPLVALAVLGLTGALPGVASAASTQALLAQAPNGTLSDAPSADLIAQTPQGTLSETPTDAGTPGSDGEASGSSSAGSASTATAATLPFTGSDPRVMLMLGLAALLAGAGLRLRTGDARDF